MKNLVLGIILGLIVAGAVCAYNTISKITNPSILAQPAKELKNVKTETLACRSLVVYQDKAKKSLNLPDEVTKSPDKKVTASTKVPASDFPNTVTSVYDTVTGATDMFVRRDKLPWLDTRDRFGIGMSGGLGSEHDSFVGKLDGYWQPAKIKMATFRVTGEVTTDGHWSVWGRTGADW